MKRLLAIITITGICIAHVAAGVFSARTAIDLAKLHGTTKSMLQTPSNDDATMLHVIVTVADVDALARLGESGATVHSCFGNSATVTMPLSDIRLLLVARIMIAALLYVLVMKLLNAKILNECIDFIRSRNRKNND